MLTKLRTALPRYRKALAAALPLVVEIVGDFVGVGTPWYVKAASAAGVLAVYLAPKNADVPAAAN